VTRRDQLALICPDGCTLVLVEETPAGLSWRASSSRLGLLRAQPAGLDEDQRVHASTTPDVPLGCRHRKLPVPPMAPSDLLALWRQGMRGRQVAYDPAAPYTGLSPALNAVVIVDWADYGRPGGEDGTPDY
jgi:hypothetical protein